MLYASEPQSSFLLRAPEQSPVQSPEAPSAAADRPPPVPPSASSSTGRPAPPSLLLLVEDRFRGLESEIEQIRKSHADLLARISLLEAKAASASPLGGPSPRSAEPPAAAGDQGRGSGGAAAAPSTTSTSTLKAAPPPSARRAAAAGGAAAVRKPASRTPASAAANGGVARSRPPSASSVSSANGRQARGAAPSSTSKAVGKPGAGKATRTTTAHPPAAAKPAGTNLNVVIPTGKPDASKKRAKKAPGKKSKPAVTVSRVSSRRARDTDRCDR